MLTTDEAGNSSVDEKYIMVPLLRWTFPLNQWSDWNINNTKWQYFVHDLGYIFLRVFFLNEEPVFRFLLTSPLNYND